ncbi:MAG: hypothetical protein ACI8QY_000600 [bacterium]|jgi:hypothetical protein
MVTPNVCLRIINPNFINIKKMNDYIVSALTSINAQRAGINYITYKQIMRSFITLQSYVKKTRALESALHLKIASTGKELTSFSYNELQELNPLVKKSLFLQGKLEMAIAQLPWKFNTELIDGCIGKFIIFNDKQRFELTL